MGSKKRTFTAALLALGVTAAWWSAACGGSTPPAEQPTASAEVSSLRMFITNEARDEQAIQSAVEASLAQAGVQLVGEKEADVVATLRVGKAEKTGFFKVVSNGKPVVNYTYQVTLQITGGGSVIDVAMTSFTGEASEVDNEKIAEIARAVAGSDKLKRYARQLERQRRTAAVEAQEAEEQKKEQEAKAEKEAKQKAEALAWIEADAPSCREPAGLESCKQLELYVAKYPDGLHAVEAKAILNGAALKLEKLREDDSAWKKAGAAACVPGASVDDCSGVEIYLVKYPAGIHANEARKTLADSKRKPGGASDPGSSLAEHIAFMKKVKAKPGTYFQRAQKAIRESRKRIGHSTNLQFKRNHVVFACLTGNWVYTRHDFSWRNQMNYSVDGSESVVHYEDGTSSVSPGLLPRSAEDLDIQAKELDKLCTEITP